MPQPNSGARQDMLCFCGNLYNPRVSDLARGWGKACSKSCGMKQRANPELKSTKVRKK